MPQTSSQSLPYWRLSSFYFFYFAVVGSLIPYWGVYLKSLGYTSQDVGVITAVIMATRIIAPNFWGWLADKTQARLSIIRSGSFAAALLFSGVLLGQEYAWLLFVVASYTFFWHAVLPQFEVITLAHLGCDHHKYSRIRLWGSLGFMAAVMGLGWLFDLFNITYLPLVILSLLILIWLSSLSLPSATMRSHKQGVGGFWPFVKEPQILCFLAASFLLQFSHGPYYTFYSLYLVEHFGYSNTLTGLLWALGVLAEVGIFLVMHKLLRYFSLRHLMLFSLLAASLRWLMIGYFADYIVMLLIAQILHAATFGIAHAVAIDLVRGHFGVQHQGQGQALYSSLSFGAGGAVGALVCGFLWDFSASLTYLLAAAASFIALGLCYKWLYLQSEVQYEQH